jgi:RNA polymerase sigma factor (sigma-70 family)
VTQPDPGPLVDHIHRLAAKASLSPMTDGDCLGRFAASGEQGAFETLIGRHGPAVLRVCRAVMGEAHAAEDVFQATFLVLARQAGTLRRHQSLVSWLRRIAVRIALHTLRNDRARASREKATPPRSPAGPLDEAGGREVRAIVFEEIARLSERYREPLLLCGLEGLSREEAAKQLGCEPGTLKSRLERGRRILSSRLARRGLGLSAGLVAAELSGAAGDTAVPAALAAATLRATVGLCANGAVAGLVSDRTARLYEQAARVAFLEKLKRAGALLLLGVALVAGSGFLLRSRAPDAPVGNLADALAALPNDVPQTVAADRAGPLRPGGHTVADSAKVTPDGKLLFYSGRQGIQTWALSPGTPIIHAQREIVGGQSDVLIAPNGKTFFTANDAGIREWDLVTSKARRSLRTGKYSRAQLSPEGTLIAALVPVPQQRLEVVEVASGGLVWSKELGKAPINGVTFSPDGRAIVVDGWASRGSPPSSDNAVRFFGARTGREGQRIELGTRVPFRIAFSPDGTRLAALYWGENADRPLERRLCVFDVTSGRELLRIDPPESQILPGHNYFSAMAFAPDGRSLFTAGSGMGLREWDLVSGRQLRQFFRGATGADALTMSPDGKALAVAGAGSIVRVVDRATEEERITYNYGFPAKPPAAYANRKPIITTGPGQTVVVQDPGTGQTKARFGSGKSVRWFRLPVGGGAFSISAQEYATSPDSKHDPGTDENLSRDSPEIPPWWAVSLDGKTIAAKDYNSDTFHDAISGKLLKSLTDPGFPGCRGVLTADGRTLFAFGPDRTVQIWDVAAASRLKEIGPWPNLRLAAPGTLMIDRRFSFAEVATQLARRPERPVDVTYAASVSPDGSRIAVVDVDGNVRLFDVATGQSAWHSGGRGYGIDTILTFSPDARSLACRCERPGDTFLFEVASGLKRGSFPLNDISRTLAFSPDGKTLVSGGNIGKATFNDLAGESKNGTRRQGPQSQVEMDAWWDLLAGADAGAAFLSMQRLAASSDAADYLRERLRPATSADDEGIDRRVGELQSESPAVRDKAAAELETFGEAVLPACRRALAGPASAEARVRLQAILDKFADGLRLPPGDDLRNVRAVEVLEWIGDRPARELLKYLAQGLPEARLTRDAKASLDRLDRLAVAATDARRQAAP